MPTKKIGIIGSGQVGQTLAKGFATSGYQVKIGSRSPEKLRDWTEEAGAQVSAGTFDNVASFGEIVVLATNGDATENAIDLARKENFSDKLVVDVTNPLDFSKGMPPGLLTKYAGTSLGETVQRKLETSRIVKCFNTVPSTVMFHPKFKDCEMLICGNDANAKQEVRKILKEFGWPGSIDLGGIENARWLEALVVLWVKTASVTGAWNSMFALVK